MQHELTYLLSQHLIDAKWFVNYIKEIWENFNVKDLFINKDKIINATRHLLISTLSHYGDNNPEYCKEYIESIFQFLREYCEDFNEKKLLNDDKVVEATKKTILHCLENGKEEIAKYFTNLLKDIDKN